MQLPDRWNARLWVRNWLCKPSGAELAQSAGIELPNRVVMSAVRTVCRADGYMVVSGVDVAQPFVVGRDGVRVNSLREKGESQ